MQKWIQGSLITGLALGLWGAGTQVAVAKTKTTPANATSTAITTKPSRPAASATTKAPSGQQVSTKRAASVTLAWRKTMGRHAYTATKGARYSQHLGTRYGLNQATATTVWYTDAHEKLVRKSTGKASIYYHVQNADGTLQGWIWRGYLTASETDTAKPAKPVTVKPTTPATGTTTAATTTDVLVGPKGKLGDKTVDQYETALRQLFPGTVEDQKLDVDARMAAWQTDAETGDWVGPNQTVIHLKTTQDADQAVHFQDYGPLLIAAGYSADKRQDYAGWHIGVAIHNDQRTNDINFGDAVIYLEPAD